MFITNGGMKPTSPPKPFKLYLRKGLDLAVAYMKTPTLFCNVSNLIRLSDLSGGIGYFHRESKYNLSYLVAILWLNHIVPCPRGYFNPLIVLNLASRPHTRYPIHHSYLRSKQPKRSHSPCLDTPHARGGYGECPEAQNVGLGLRAHSYRLGANAKAYSHLPHTHVGGNHQDSDSSFGL